MLVQIYSNSDMYLESSRLVIDSWTEFKPQMSTSCEKFYNARACNGWRLQGTFIDSGDNWENHMIRSNLELNIEVWNKLYVTYFEKITAPTGGAVTFEYKASGENYYDFFLFAVNKVQVLRVAIQDWTSFTYVFPGPGFYNLAWMYSKDISFSYGEDMAKIRVRAILQNIIII